MDQHKPSEAELEILQILWESQPCTVRIVHEKISAKREIGYTTTLKQMQRMLEKGLLTRQDGSGKSHNYSAAIPADEMRGNLFDKLLEGAFGNSVGQLVMHALGKGKTSDEEVEEIKKLLSELESKKK
ncbi:MAG: BlaI/MecI/CopY family transcriptional regulator [bacterium]|nr:BlaI/MecI/CopY family transcriptional regulator [bacterium]